MPQTEARAGLAEGSGTIAGTVVGHDPLGGDAGPGMVGDGGLEEGHGCFLAFARQDRHMGDPRVVVDADMDELPAGTACRIAAVARDPVSDTFDAAEFLDVDVDQLTRTVAFMASHRFSRLQGCQPVQPEPAQDTVNGRPGDAGFPGDLGAGPAPAP